MSNLLHDDIAVLKKMRQRAIDLNVVILPSDILIRFRSPSSRCKIDLSLSKFLGCDKVSMSRLEIRSKSLDPREGACYEVKLPSALSQEVLD